MAGRDTVFFLFLFVTAGKDFDNNRRKHACFWLVTKEGGIGMIGKYKILMNALDNICMDAPTNFGTYSLQNKSEEQINNIRSKAYIHLYLLVKFGVQDFEERHNYITDGPHDGGIDAYYIDSKSKTIFLLQSKYRVTEENYETKEIDPSEIVTMELKRILEGETIGADGENYNGKIQGFQKKLSSLENLNLYNFKIILLANLYSSSKLRVVNALFNGYEYEVFNYKRAYDELVFPLCTNTYFQGDKIIIDEKIEGTTNAYTETFNNTSYGKCSVTLLFVPLLFVARIIEEYKNSILQYNPRNYLSMSKNSVNKSISEGLENEYEDFALLNNGITLICSRFSSTTLNGLRDATNVHIENPQIINGGQTAFTLARVMKENDATKLANKKVLLKIIATYQEDKNDAAETPAQKEQLVKDYHIFINTISDATNKQTKIEEADRRANLEIQVELQRGIYQKYGLLYERKAGEFEEAVHKKIIPSDQIIKRDILIRSLKAIQGFCGDAMTASKDDLFRKEYFDKVINETVSPESAAFACRIFSYAKKLEAVNKRKENPNWGYGVKYGKYALVMATGRVCSENLEALDSLEKLDEVAQNCLLAVLNRWNVFETYVAGKEENKAYFGDELNYYNYYKSRNSQNDIVEYWKKGE